MSTSKQRLRHALAALRVEHRPSRLRSLLRHHGPSWVEQQAPDLDAQMLDEVEAEADDLATRGVDVTWLGDGRYPAALFVLDKAPPMLFTVGNTDLMSDPSVGMCGSR